MNIFRVLLELFVLYMLYKFIFDFIIPIYRTTKQVKKQFGDMSAQMQENMNQQRQAYTNATTDLIVVELPFPGAVVGKQFSVIGKARGMWFFEASFPIEILDKNGAVLATGIAQAQSDWMTTEFVPFKADISIPLTYIGKATLVAKKDNPSGLPEHDGSISFPLTIEY